MLKVAEKVWTIIPRAYISWIHNILEGDCKKISELLNSDSTVKKERG